MAKQTINVGSSANDGTGDKNRVAFQKINANFTELYDGQDPANLISTDPDNAIELGTDGKLWSVGFIPLSGTEVGKPITGDLELSTNVIIKSYDLGEDKLKQINFGDNFLELSVSDTTYSASIGLYLDGIQVSNSTPGSRGLISFTDFSANIQDLDYTQKIYVDSNFVQKGVDNATTVVLSSATLNSTYPTATTGFRVYCASIIVGAMTYEKTPTGWLGFTCVVP